MSNEIDEQHIRAAMNIKSLRREEANELMAMMANLMYFDTVPSDYKVIIRDVFEIDIEFEVD